MDWTITFYSDKVEEDTLAVFCTVPEREVVILMTAIKKSNKLPKRLLQTAQKRKKEVHTNE